MFGVQCVFGGAGCSWTPGVLTAVFIAGYIMTVCGCALLLRYSEGATLLAIVTVSYILSVVLLTSDPEATLLPLLGNILCGLFFAHLPPPPPPSLPHFTKNKVHCHFEIPLHTLFKHFGGSVSDYCLLVICVNCFASTLHSFEFLWGWTCSTIYSDHEQAP